MSDQSEHKPAPKRKNNRPKSVKLRLTKDEYDRLQNLKTQTQLAVWARELCLSGGKTTNKNSYKLRRLVEQNRLLQILNKHLKTMGSNLNQIAKHANTDAQNDVLNSAKLLLELAKVSEQLDELTKIQNQLQHQIKSDKPQTRRQMMMDL